MIYNVFVPGVSEPVGQAFDVMCPDGFKFLPFEEDIMLPTEVFESLDDIADWMKDECIYADYEDDIEFKKVEIPSANKRR